MSSITPLNKASGGDGISAELFKFLWFAAYESEK